MGSRCVMLSGEVTEVEVTLLMYYSFPVQCLKRGVIFTEFFFHVLPLSFFINLYIYSLVFPLFFFFSFDMRVHYLTDGSTRGYVYPLLE